MAIYKCPECRGKVSSKAAACPHCGAAVNGDQLAAKKKKDDNRAGAVILVAIVVVVLYLAFAPNDESSHKEPEESAETWQDRDNSSMAYIMMEDFVKKRLKAPSTAEFQGIFSGRGSAITKKADHVYAIRSYVDAQNSFGATVRMHFHGRIEQTSERNWRLLSLTLQ